jgi:hypothetical protein
MQTDHLYRNLLYRYSLKKQFVIYSEFETNVLFGIYVMNRQFQRCSGNTLFKYLSQIHRTPYKKSLLAAIRKFKSDGCIRATGKGSGANIHLTEFGKQHLSELEERLNGINLE